MIFKITLGCIITIYSALTLFAFLSNKQIKASPVRVVVCIVSCALLFASNAGLVLYKYFFIWTLCAGLLLLQVMTLLNGFLLHKRPHWLHHFIRLMFSIIIIVFYISFA